MEQTGADELPGHVPTGQGATRSVMQHRQPLAGPTGVRALVISERSYRRAISSSVVDECEDLLLTLGGAELYLLDAQHQYAHRPRRVLGRTLRRVAGSKTSLPAGRAMAPMPDTGFDVAIAIMYSVWSTVTLESLGGLRRTAGSLVGWFPEVWPSQIHRNLAREPFHLLDAIFVGEPESAELLSRLLKRPVHLLPPATDVAVFSATGRTPTEPRSDRPIDVLNIGRRDDELHRELLQWSKARDAFYVFDTLQGAHVAESAEHRRALASQLQRTKVKIASYAKRGDPEVGDLRWIPGRVFDGLASGTLLAGHAPERTAQIDLFGREVVHDLSEADPRQAATEIARLVDTDGAAERRANVATAMAGHDWSHRWVQLFETSGLRPPSRIADRARELSASSGDGPARG